MIDEALVIVNPAAGRGLGERLEASVAAELSRHFARVRTARTEGPGDAAELSRAARPGELVVAVGGDGTVRDAASGIVGLDVALRPELAIVPVGSGNDFLKTLGIPTAIPDACRVARYGGPRLIDVVRCTVADADGERTLYSVNAAGFGFDALVVREAQGFRKLRGLPLYTAAVFRAVRSYTCPLVRVAAGDEEWEQRVLLIAAANGKYYGGGMRIGPDAEPDDGLLDVCVCGPMNRLGVMRSLPRLIAGTHVTMPEVRMVRSRTLGLEFLEPVTAQLDGDLLPLSGPARFRLEVLPRALSVRV